MHTTKTLTDIVKSFAPYDTMEAFGQGFVDYQRGQHNNPHDGNSVAAQAWDRGHMACSEAMSKRVICHGSPWPALP